jgi:RNA-binding protein
MTEHKMPKKKKQASAKPTVRIGKNGPSETLIKEISRQLDENRTIKVKVLKTGLADEQMGEMAQKTAAETESKIVQMRGHTFTLFKPRKS